MAVIYLKHTHNLIYNMTATKEQKKHDVSVADTIDSGAVSKLIIYNDDFNTFDWVIKSLMDICKHTAQQAEQLPILIHYKGKATVKTGPRRVVHPMKNALVDRGISAVMEED